MSTLIRIAETGSIVSIDWENDLTKSPKNLGFSPEELSLEIVARSSFTEGDKTYIPPSTEIPLEPEPEPDEMEEIKHRLIAVESYTGTISKWMNPKSIDSAYPAGIRVEYKGDIYENTSGDYTMEEPSLHSDWTLVP